MCILEWGRPWKRDRIKTGLRINDAVGETTLVRFRVEAATETLDGVAPAEL
jgi:hypothetical protein